MTVRTELESIELAIAKLRRDIETLQESVREKGPRWMTTRAGLRQGWVMLGVATARVREAAEFIPEGLDFDS